MAMKSWFYFGDDKRTVDSIPASKSEPLDVGAIILSGKKPTPDTTSDTQDEDEDDGTSDSHEDEPINPEKFMRPINPNYKTPGQLAKEKAEAQEKADEALLNGMSSKKMDAVQIRQEDSMSDTPSPISEDERSSESLNDLYSPSRPDFKPLTQAEFIAIPMDAKTEALRNLRRFEPELADYYTYQNAETTRKTLTMSEWQVDETMPTYNIDAPAIPSDWVISRELLFFPSETIETPNWPITYQNILIKRLHPLTERDRIDSLLDTNRISEFFPQKIVEQIKKYDDGVMPKKLYESRVARQVARRNEDKKQKEDEEFERMLEAEDA